MARTLGYPAASRDLWETDFRERWPRLVGDAGRAIAAADPESIRAARDDLSSLVDDVGAVGPSSTQWPVYGALIINLRNTLDAMDEVAAANPLGQPPLPLAGLKRLGSGARVRLRSRALDDDDAATGQ